MEQPAVPAAEDVSRHPKRKSPDTSRPRGKIATLPATVRHEINLKVQDGWHLGTIVRWLFAQTADRDIPDFDLKTGDSYSLAWTRIAKNGPAAEDNCRFALSRWTRAHHKDWLRDEIERSTSIRLIERMQQLGAIAFENEQGNSWRGGKLVIRSMLINAIENVRNNGNDPDQLLRLAQAWSQMK